MTVRIVSKPVLLRDLKPGDLWSFAGPEHWDGAMDRSRSRRAPLYIRNNLPVPTPMIDYLVYRIDIEKDEKDDAQLS